VYFEEDSASKIYLIETGKIKLGYYTEDGKEVEKAILTKGELFGEKAILGEEKRNEFAQSLDNSTSICPIGINTMHDLMRDNKTFSLKIYKFLGLRFKKLERRLQSILFKDTRTRLLEFMSDLCEEYGYDCKKSGDKVIVHPYTQKDIASLIGTSRSNLNVLMNELKEENIINFNRKEIRLIQKIA
jgi:CRP-like cAMP-binding protein